jgi:flagellar biosynthesis/type III secretory pathway M-ring protein FliF/YscJ
MLRLKKRSLWIAVAFVLVLAAAVTWTMTSKMDNSPYVNLVSYKLNKKQLQEVEAFLQDEGYEYQVKEKSVLVHENQLQEILVRMSEEGIPSP